MRVMSSVSPFPGTAGVPPAPVKFHPQRTEDEARAVGFSEDYEPLDLPIRQHACNSPSLRGARILVGARGTRAVPGNDAPAFGRGLLWLVATLFGFGGGSPGDSVWSVRGYLILDDRFLVWVHLFVMGHVEDECSVSSVRCFQVQGQVVVFKAEEAEPTFVFSVERGEPAQGAFRVQAEYEGAAQVQGDGAYLEDVISQTHHVAVTIRIFRSGEEETLGSGGQEYVQATEAHADLNTGEGALAAAAQRVAVEVEEDDGQPQGQADEVGQVGEPEGKAIALHSGAPVRVRRGIRRRVASVMSFSVAGQPRFSGRATTAVAFAPPHPSRIWQARNCPKCF